MKQSDKLILSTILSVSIVSSGIGCINVKSRKLFKQIKIRIRLATG